MENQCMDLFVPSEIQKSSYFFLRSTESTFNCKASRCCGVSMKDTTRRLLSAEDKARTIQHPILWTHNKNAQKGRKGFCGRDYSSI